MRDIKQGVSLEKPNQYFYDINFIRAFASLSVVMVHVTAANYHLNNEHLNWLLLFFNQISRFATPMFAVISGFLLYNQAIQGRYQLKRFINSRFTKILLPFIIWSLIYLFLKKFSFSDVNDMESIKEFLYNFFLGKSYVHLYFIAVVLQFYLVFPIIQRFHSKKQLLCLTVIGLYINAFYLIAPPNIGDGMLNQFLHERAIIFNWIFYFFFGGLLVHFWNPLIEYIKDHMKSIALLGIVPLLFMTYEYITSGVILGSTRLTNLMHVPILFIVFISVYYLLGAFKKLKNMMLIIGNMSMGIYLVHPLVIYFIQHGEFNWILERTRWIALGYIITVLISIIIVKLIHKLPFGQYIVIIATGKGKK